MTLARNWSGDSWRSCKKKDPGGCLPGVLLCTDAHLPLRCLPSHLLTQLPTTLAMTDTRKLVKISSMTLTSFCCLGISAGEGRRNHYTSIRQDVQE